VLPDLLSEHPDELADEAGLPVELIRAVGAIPSYYLHYYYRTAEALEHQRTHRTRAEEVMEIEAGLLEMYRDPALDTKPKLLEERGGAFYSDAAAALVASLHAGTGDIQVVNARNDGAIAGLPDDAVVEVSCTVGAEGARPIPVEPLAPDMLGLVQLVKAYELLTIDAATSGSRTAALNALMTNPLVGDWDTAAPLLDALLEANRAHLPRFFPEG
jgi:6-phospho-beta-glucosidase